MSDFVCCKATGSLCASCANKLRAAASEARAEAERNAAAAVEGNMRAVRAETEAATARASRDRAVEVLREVTLDALGGTPDLFAPRGGWDAWNDRAAAVLRGEHE